MAREAFSASILESNLESLKNKTTEVADQFKQLSGSAEKFGVTFSQSVRAATGNLQALESALTRLNQGLKRTTTTGSAIGAANISSALGQLTGQGGRGGGGGGGAAGRGGFAPASFGSGAGLIPKPKGMWGLAANTLKFGVGALVGAAKQGRDAQLQHQQGSYLSSYLGKPQAAATAFKSMEELGMDANRSRDIYDSIARSMGGGTRPFAMNKTKLSTMMGLKPEALGGMGDAIRAGGGGRGTFDETYGQGLNIADISRRKANALVPGRGDGKKQIRSAEMDRTNEIMTQGLTGFYQHQASMSYLRANTLRKAPQFRGALRDDKAGIGDRTANRMLGALRGSTLAPGGGEAGEVFAMQSAGFGNPYLAAEQAKAKSLGVDAKLQRRDFLSATKFRQDQPIEAILNQMIGVAAKYAGGGVGIQGMALSKLTKGQISQSQSETLMQMLQSGNFSAEKLKEGIRGAKANVDPLETLNLSKKEREELEKRATGRGGVGFLKNVAKLNNAILGSSKAILKVTEAITKAQIEMHQAASRAADGLVVFTEGLVKVVDQIAAKMTTGEGENAPRGGQASKLRERPKREPQGD